MLNFFMNTFFYLTHRWESNRYYHSGQSGPGSNGDEGVLHIPQTSKTGTSPSDSLMSFPGQEDPQPPPSSTHMIKRFGA